MAQLHLTYEAPATTPEPPQPPPPDKDWNDRPPGPDGEAPETPPTEPEPVPVQDPPSEPGSRGPYVV